MLASCEENPLYLTDYIGNPRALRLNLAGEPVEWVNYRDAACLYARALVVWTLGDVILRLRGGHNRMTARQTTLSIHSIIACRGPVQSKPKRQAPPLTNKALFNRDHHLCLYCGKKFSAIELTRDHVVPKQKGGKDTWTNCVTACRRCNHRKGSQTLKASGLQLLALPYRPNHAEYLALINSGRILGDQLQFLQVQFRRKGAHGKELLSAVRS